MASADTPCGRPTAFTWEWFAAALAQWIFTGRCRMGPACSRLCRHSTQAGLGRGRLTGEPWVRAGESRTRSDLWAIDLKGQRAFRPLVQTPARETAGRVSPDGRWLAYVSDETGRAELYVVPFQAREPRWQISHGGAREAIWSRDGRGCLPERQSHDGGEGGGDKNILARSSGSSFRTRLLPGGRSRHHELRRRAGRSALSHAQAGG